jgi:hypothetical protein
MIAVVSAALNGATRRFGNRWLTQPDWQAKTAAFALAKISAVDI